MLDKLMTFGLDCVQTLAAYQKQESQRVGLQTWEGIGFKYLSFQGYDVDGLRVINYGSSEYFALLEFWSLRNPEILAELHSLRYQLPVYMDLWKPNTTVKHKERLADVVGIMGGLRGEPLFKQIWDELQEICRMKQLFSELLTLKARAGI